jgi:rare lipoprotein A
MDTLRISEAIDETGWRIRRMLFVGFMGLGLLAGCAATPPKPKTPGAAEIGLASYYADRLHGRLTANGERYDRQALTAAHLHLPFGTRVVVTRLDDGRAVTVRINDRGPFVHGRIIDLSHAAAAKLGMLQQGVVEVRVVRLE